MSFCPECGRARTTSTRYCGGCGRDFGVAADDEASPPTIDHRTDGPGRSADAQRARAGRAFVPSPPIP